MLQITPLMRTAALRRGGSRPTSLMLSAPPRRWMHAAAAGVSSSSLSSTSWVSHLNVASSGSCGEGGAWRRLHVAGSGAVAMRRPLITSHNAQRRWLSWNPLKWGRGDVGRSTTAVEEELPEIFANQPEEVDDYIRPDKSTFEHLEDMWDWVVSFMQPVEKQMEIMRSIRHNGLLGYDFSGWGTVFFIYGIGMRLLTLLPSLYSHRNTLRMNLISPQISEITTNQNKAKNDRTLSTAEKRVIKDGYNRMKYALCKKNGCSQWKSFLTMMTAPITMSAFLSIRRLAMYETDLEMAPFLWVRDLTMPDPTYALPAICAGMFLLNFELNQRMQKGGRSASGMYIRWAVRASSVVGVYFFASQPSAMFAYWIGLSTAGLLQPLLLRWQPFREYFGFPDPPQAAKTQIISDIRGPSFYERFFASSAERAKREAERAAQVEAQQTQRFDRIDNYEIVVDEVFPPKRR